MSTNVLEKIVESKRLPILFIGSGISKRYLYRYPNWDELLDLSFKKYNSDSFQLQKYKDTFIRDGLTSFEINAELGSIIENDFNAAFFDRKFKIGNSKNPQWVKRGISPFKMFLSTFFKKMQLTNNPDLLDEIQKFKNLKTKVSAVITTNYDRFLEEHVFSSDYTVFVRQNQLFSSDSYNIAEIYKIHGCVTDAESIVITKQDYENFEKSRKLIIAKMLTLFAESPIIFMGYSFTDENVRNIITEFLSCLTPIELENIHEHFVFISYKKGIASLNEINRIVTTDSGAEIPITEIQTDNFSLVFDTLNQITPGISPVRVRETRRVIKTIVDKSIASSDEESVIVGIEDLNNMDLSTKPLAIAIGYKEKLLNVFGYGVLSDISIFEDILYDNKNFDANEMCKNRFKSIASNRLLPVFKYIKNSTSTLDPESKLSKYVELHNSKETIVSKTVKKTLKNILEINDYDTLLFEMNQQPDLNKKAGLLLKNIDSFNTNQIRDICKIIFEIDDSEEKELIKASTNFKRCVMCLDLLENY